MRKNNAWNNLFHKADVQKNVKQMSIYTKQCLEGQRFLDKIEESYTLITLMNIHKDAWRTGFQNENIGPCPYGMFRTLDIPSMTPDQIYLGGIWGLVTKPIPFWEKHKDDKYGCNGFGIDKNLSLYEMIVDQYKELLSSNIRALFNKARNDYPLYKSLGYQNFLYSCSIRDYSSNGQELRIIRNNLGSTPRQSPIINNKNDREMKKVFECSNGVEFFSDGESVLGALSKEEAMGFVSSIAIDAQKSGEKVAAQAASMLLQAIDKSYVQLSEVVEVEVIIII